MTDINVNVTEPSPQVIAVTVNTPGDSGADVVVTTPNPEVVYLSVSEPASDVVNVTVADPSVTVIPVTVLGGGISGSSVPDGGQTGEVLAKRSPVNQDMEWIPNQVLTAQLYTDEQITLHVQGEDPHSIYWTEAEGIAYVTQQQARWISTS